MRALTSSVPLVLGDQLTDASNGATFETVNPADGSVIAKVAEATVKTSPAPSRPREPAPRRAADAALAAHPSDAALRGVIEASKERLAELQTRDMDKLIRESATIDLPVMVETVEYFAGLVTKIEADDPGPGCFPHHGARADRRGRCDHPVEFPRRAVDLEDRAGPGDGQLHRPEAAQLDPSCRWRWVNAGGRHPRRRRERPARPRLGGGNALVQHPGVGKVTFTGSTEIGQEIGRMAADRLITTSLELGGKSALVAFADASPKAVADVVFTAMYGNQGETCTAPSRLLVERPIDHEVVELVKALGPRGPGRRPARPSRRRSARWSTRRSATRFTPTWCRAPRRVPVCWRAAPRLRQRVPGFFYLLALLLERGPGHHRSRGSFAPSSVCCRSRARSRRSSWRTTRSTASRPACSPAMSAGPCALRDAGRGERDRTAGRSTRPRRTAGSATAATAVTSVAC